MQGRNVLVFHSGLKALVVEASRALAQLDAARLEELALCCQALNRDLQGADPPARAEIARQARAAQADLAVFGRVLEATRANIAVMNRIRALRTGRTLGYSEIEARTGIGHGDN
jgi:aminopeptidase N